MTDLKERLRAVRQFGPLSDQDHGRIEAADRIETLERALREAVLQLEYLDEKYPTGTTPAIIAKISDALSP